MEQTKFEVIEKSTKLNIEITKFKNTLIYLCISTLNFLIEQVIMILQKKQFSRININKICIKKPPNKIYLKVYL